MNRTRRPNFSSPIATSINPARKPTSASASAPWLTVTCSSSGTRAAVGPVMLNREPPKMLATAPAKAAV